MRQAAPSEAMAPSAETSNSSFGHRNISNLLHECSNIPLARGTDVTLVAVAILVGLPLNVWLLVLFAKSLQAGLATFDIPGFNTAVVQSIYCLLTPSAVVEMYLPNKYSRYVTLTVTGLSTVGWSQFQTWTCVKRYFAVVHPVAFLKMRSVKYQKYRMMCGGVLWLITVYYCWFVNFTFPYYPFEAVSAIFAFVLVVNTFCSLSILCALCRPAPGHSETGGMRSSNLQAFSRVLTTQLLATCAFTPYIFVGIASDRDFTAQHICLSLTFAGTATVATTIIQPLLTLSQMGKLPSKKCVTCSSINQAESG